MVLSRTRFGKDIVAEFVMPSRRFTGKVLILCGGLPSKPDKTSTAKFWAARGYLVLAPRYRGTWESSGHFLRTSPENDIKDIITSLTQNGLKDIVSREVFKFHVREINILGSSFGGTTAILASRDKRVNKVVALSPVVDWRIKSRLEPLDRVDKYLRLVFGEAYRFTNKDWNKLKSGRFFNPVNYIAEFKPEKILIVHALDDKVVAFKPVARFAKLLGSRMKKFNKGGHYGLSSSTRPSIYRPISSFLKAK